MPGDPPPGTATAAGGTHPTGMHSCFKTFWRFFVVQFSKSYGESSSTWKNVIRINVKASIDFST